MSKKPHNSRSELVKIHVSDLKIGMYVQSICGKWMDNPFWRNSMMIDDFSQLGLFRNSSLDYVWVNITKGRGPESDPEEESDQEDLPLPVKPPTPKIPAVKKEPVAPSFDGEYERARLFSKNMLAALDNALSASGNSGIIDHQTVSEINSDVVRSVNRNPHALVSLMLNEQFELGYDQQHALSLSALMVALGIQLDLDRETLMRVGMAGLLMDIGKTALPQRLLKKHGKLTEDEFELVKQHTVLGKEILIKSGIDDEIVLDVCLNHHERSDGSGYRQGLTNDQLSLYAKMAAVCDVYHAIISTKNYSGSYAPAIAIRKMTEWQNAHFDRLVFQAFVRVVGVYPVGTLLQLRSGRIGVVIQQVENLARPIVKVFYSLKTNSYILPEVVDLTKSKDEVVCIEQPSLGLVIPF